MLPPAPFLSFTIAFVAFVGYHLLRFVLTAPKVDSEVLCASIAVYLLMGICWAFTYILVGKLIPDAFVFSTGGAGQSMIGFEAAYFSFVTLTTCGFGDVVPVANVARMLAVLEAVTGMFYVAILIARLVSVYSSSSPPGQNNGHSEVQS